MSDRELLALAAKAAGIEYKHENKDWKHDDHCAFWSYDDLCTCGARWNPLDDDGDALRLAVKLGLDVEMHGANSAHPYVGAFCCKRNIAEEVQPEDGDPYAATRRAIVRAAAEIEKGMDADAAINAATENKT